MTKQIIRFMLAALIAVSVMSCATAPKKGSGLPDYLIQAKTQADNSRAKAMDIKASVAAKASFDQAEAGYNAAKTLETAADYESAASGYTGAADLFTKAYDEAAAKKDAALKSIGNAEAERKASEEALSNAAEEQAGTAGKGE